MRVTHLPTGICLASVHRTRDELVRLLGLLGRVQTYHHDTYGKDYTARDSVPGHDHGGDHPDEADARRASPGVEP
jgi:hypothetical protein